MLTPQEIMAKRVLLGYSLRALSRLSRHVAPPGIHYVTLYRWEQPEDCPQHTKPSPHLFHVWQKTLAAAAAENERRTRHAPKATRRT